jgi:hypothetical protein
MTTQTVSGARVGNLILARLLTAGKRPPAPKKLRDDLGRFFHHAPTDDQWQGYLDELVQAGMLTLRPCQLTEAGRASALEFLGVSEIPAEMKWDELRMRFLFPKALGSARISPETLTELKRKDKFEAFLLATQFNLPAESTTSLNKALEALACKELGVPEETTLEGAQTRALGRLLGTNEKLSMKQIKKQLPAHLLGARRSGMDGLRDILLQRWAESPGNTHPVQPMRTEPKPVSELDLPTFAATVHTVARTCPGGRVGDNMVYINHVWRQLQSEPGFPHKDLRAFKHELIQAHHAGLLKLGRGDMVGEMNTPDMHESQTGDQEAVYYFIHIDKNRM